MALDSRIKDSLDNFGFAQVLVVLKPEIAAATRAATESGTFPRHSLIQNEDDDLALLTLALDSPQDAGPTEAVVKRFHDAENRLSTGGGSGLAAALDFSSGNAADGRAAMTMTRVFPRLGVAIGYVDGRAARALDRDKDNVQSLHNATALSLIQPVSIAETVPMGTVTWGLDMLGIPALWSEGLTGKGVRVGHLDTGVDRTHPAFQGGQIAAFQQFDLLGNPVAETQNKAFDSAIHGTHTAGTICGGVVGGMHIGVAPEAELHSAMVIEGGNTLLRVLTGMEWCITQSVRILSMSLGFRGFNPIFGVIMERLEENGILPVIAIGNEGPNTSRSPGNYPQSLSVGAIDQAQEVASFSSSSLFSRTSAPQVPQIVAPGVDILSAIPDGRVAAMSGTSMATPHVAGIAALLLQKSPAASNDQIREAIFSTCLVFPEVPLLRQGRGLVNPAAAIHRLP